MKDETQILQTYLNEMFGTSWENLSIHQTTPKSGHQSVIGCTECTTPTEEKSNLGFSFKAGSVISTDLESVTIRYY